ncbi:hypothetical protein EWM64_g9830 [Hericium alpestre]|uniref:Uncharacterized protein n=1 Tax=Hericium alpestre TaxID=135208 RepID=A0A4Y9ZJZ7_9AGAM|nr:hypothetical protein EWM64_g9830 [Hericium alpestre]
MLPVAPNQHSWTKTAPIMISTPKGKKCKKFVDPYAGGEQSENICPAIECTFCRDSTAAINCAHSHGLYMHAGPF